MQPTHSAAEIILTLCVLYAGILFIGKVLMHFAALHGYHEEMKYRRHVPHATAPPSKPTFFKNKKR